MEQYVDEHEVPFPVLYDEGGMWNQNTYDALGPVGYLIGRDGTVVFQYPMNEELIEAQIRIALGLPPNKSGAK
jgi:hypothetical protein